MRTILIIILAIVGIELSAQVLTNISNPNGLNTLVVDATNTKFIYDRSVSRDSLFQVCEFTASPFGCNYRLIKNITPIESSFILTKDGKLFIPKRQLNSILKESKIVLNYEIFAGVLSRKYQLNIYLIKK
jgi:hypothetical protein